MMEPKLIAIIPHYNHSDKIGNVINQLHKLNLPVLVVDDGSSEQHKKALSSLSEKDNLHIHYCSQNQGKGGAMKVGFRLAFEQGFTHTLQVDADGQHNLIDALLMQQKCSKIRPHLFVVTLYTVMMHLNLDFMGEKLRIFGMPFTHFLSILKMACAVFACIH